MGQPFKRSFVTGAEIRLLLQIKSFGIAELDQVREWYEQFSEKYPIVGKLLGPDETATVYTDDEEDVDENKVQEENKAISGTS